MGRMCIQTAKDQTVAKCITITLSGNLNSIQVNVIVHDDDEGEGAGGQRKENLTENE